MLLKITAYEYDTFLHPNRIFFYKRLNIRNFQSLIVFFGENISLKLSYQWIRTRFVVLNDYNMYKYGQKRTNDNIFSKCKVTHSVKNDAAYA